jgi:hypothetical protein
VESFDRKEKSVLFSRRPFRRFQIRYRPDLPSQFTLLSCIYVPATISAQLHSNGTFPIITTAKFKSMALLPIHCSPTRRCLLRRTAFRPKPVIKNSTVYSKFTANRCVCGGRCFSNQKSLLHPTTADLLLAACKKRGTTRPTQSEERSPNEISGSEVVSQNLGSQLCDSSGIPLQSDL